MWHWYTRRFEPNRFTLTRTRFPVYGLDRPGEWGGGAWAGTRWRMQPIRVSLKYGAIVVATEITDDAEDAIGYALIERQQHDSAESFERALVRARTAKREQIELVCDGVPRPALTIASATSRAALLTLAAPSGTRLAVTVTGPADAFDDLALVRLRRGPTSSA